jgi:hypothetical protein
LLSLIGASLGTFMVLTLNAAMWIFDHKTELKTGARRRTKILFALSTFTIVVGMFLLGAGTWGAGTVIAQEIKDGIGEPFSCKDTS